MGILFNSQNEIRDAVYEEFNNTENYLVAIKHDDVVKNLLKLLASNLFYTIDSNRTFVINFNEDGIYEKENSNSTKRDFLLMPWSEIEDFGIIEKNNKVFIEFKHIGKDTGYEIPFNGKIFKDNGENIKKLKSKDFYLI